MADSSVIIAGRNSVCELLMSEREIEKIYIQRGIEKPFASKIYQLAKKRGVPVSEADKKRLDELAADHRGVVALTSDHKYCDVNDIIEYALSRGEKPFIVIADGVNDPHNLGAIIRSAECAGAHGIIIPKHRSVQITQTVITSSAGAVNHIMISRVPNLSSAIEALKSRNIWVYAAEADGQPVESCKFDSGTALIFGGEGTGVSRLVKENADFIVSIQMYVKLNSLNVSAAAAIMLFEAAKKLKK